MRYITEDMIESTTHACPYCGDEVSIEPTEMCCGEVHAEKAYFIDGEILFRHEFEIVEECVLQSASDMSDKWKQNEDR